MAAEPEKADARSQPLLAPDPWRADQVLAAVRRTASWVSRPRVRLTITGILLLLVGGLVLSNSVWTLPLVIVGALMVAVAWVGHRLDGRFTVEWGEAGTELAFRATIKAAPERLGLVPHPEAVPAPEAVTTADGVIEGEAHTVEIDVAELKALIAAAEAQESGTDPQGEADIQDIRIRRIEHSGPRIFDPPR
jgi:hypothetical protein